jgi:hypothetical protein
VFSLNGISLSLPPIDRSEPFTAFLFFRKDSSRAGEALLAELRAKGGKLTRKEMGEFVKKLESGKMGFRFSKDNFYKRVLRTFVQLGFIGTSELYDPARRKSVTVYRPIAQPTSGRRPANPSFLYVAYLIGEWWNELMFPE